MLNDFDKDFYNISSKKVYESFSETAFLKDVSGIAGALESYGKLVQKFYKYEKCNSGKAHCFINKAEMALRKAYGIYCHASYSPSENNINRISSEFVTMRACLKKAHKYIMDITFFTQDNRDRLCIKKLCQNEENAFAQVISLADEERISSHLKIKTSHRYYPKYAWENTRTMDIVVMMCRMADVMRDASIYVSGDTRTSITKLSRLITADVRMIAEKKPDTIENRLVNIESKTAAIIPEMQSLINSMTRQAKTDKNNVLYQYSHELWDAQQRLEMSSSEMMQSDFAIQCRKNKQMHQVQDYAMEI